MKRLISTTPEVPIVIYRRFKCYNCWVEFDHKVSCIIEKIKTCPNCSATQEKIQQQEQITFWDESPITPIIIIKNPTKSAICPNFKCPHCDTTIIIKPKSNSTIYCNCCTHTVAIPPPPYFNSEVYRKPGVFDFRKTSRYNFDQLLPL